MPICTAGDISTALNYWTMCDSGCDTTLETPLGRLGIRMQGDAVIGLDFLSDETMSRRTPAAELVATQISDYLHDAKHGFDIPLAPRGTEFQRRVWQALLTIPSGTVLTYGELAAGLGSGARAVGGACRVNPIPLLIPCHRVVAASGLGGYAGATDGEWLRRKRWLLHHEGVLDSA